MSFGVHIVNTGLFKVDATGNVVLKDDSATLRQHLSTGMEHRVIPSADVPTSVGYPTVKEFLVLEAAAGYVLNHMDQTTIVTYLMTAEGGYGEL